MAGTLVFTVLLVAVSAAAHWVLATWAIRSWAFFARHAGSVRVLTALVVVVTPAARYFAVLTSDGSVSPRLLAFGMVELMAVLLAAFPLLVLRLAASLRGASASADIDENESTRGDPAHELDEPAPPVMGRRDAIERIGGLAAIGTTSAVLGWGMVRGRHAFAIEEVPIVVRGLPRALDGYTLVQISDLHVGLFVGERELAEGLELVGRAKPDMVIVTGDLVDFDARYVPLMARSLARLSARDGVTAIVGNHDYYTGVSKVLEGLASARIRTLLNDAVHVRPNDGGGFGLLGVDDYLGRRRGHGPSLQAVLDAAPRDRPRILLSHQPKFFNESAGHVDLQLSGHTHGGQINPGFRPASLFMEYIAGRYEHAGSQLYVNRGFGVAGPPSRVGAPPEVTKIVLVAG